jgi:hypothetical protein
LHHRAEPGGVDAAREPGGAVVQNHLHHRAEPGGVDRLPISFRRRNDGGNIA